MKDCIDYQNEEINEYLKKLIGKPLRYGVKSPDTELYDFGFGDKVETVGYDGAKRIREEYILHALCRFELIWKRDRTRTNCNWNTDYAKFRKDITPLIGLNVNNVKILAKNDLLLDFDSCYIFFHTNINGNESWRFFTAYIEQPHLVATNLAINFE